MKILVQRSPLRNVDIESATKEDLCNSMRIYLRGAFGFTPLAICPIFFTDHLQWTWHTFIPSYLMAPMILYSLVMALIVQLKLSR